MASAGGTRWDVFLAHAGADAEQGCPMAELLQHRGVTVCLDAETLCGGDDWHERLPEHQAQCLMTW
ncbi:MAG: hypothetical protein R2705_16845 [Ilumatobacteraceae bacterium]